MKIFKLTIPKRQKRVARIMLFIMLFEICAPLHSFALTSGPAQPEFQSFTPIGNNDMVDLFSGNFGYSIPLMEIDGYPINLGYSNVDNADQEASWVGLGWNINLGEVNRVVRGLPDDFKNETIERRVHMKNQVDGRIDLGVNMEIFGFKMKKIKGKMKKVRRKSGGKGSLGIYYGNNNYYGQYGGISLGIDRGMQLGRHGLSAGLNMDFSSNKGGNIGVSGGYIYSTDKEKKWIQRMGLNMSHGYNTRQGYSSPVISGSYSLIEKDKLINGITRYGSKPWQFLLETEDLARTGFSLGGAIVPGLINYVPTMTNQTNIDAYNIGFSLPGLKLIGGLYGTVSASYSHSTTMLKNNGDKNGFGYLYLGYSQNDDLLDYRRDNSGVFNKNIPNLPMATTTHDIYQVNAHGAGGSFRPFRNDRGVLHDPRVQENNNVDNFGIAAELGFGTMLEIGLDFKYTNVKFESGILPGPKKKRVPGYKSFNTNLYGASGQIYSGLNEPYFFKQQGEFSLNQAYNGRRPRSNMFYFYDGAMASKNDVSYTKKIQNYTSDNGLISGVATSKTPIDRVSGNRKSHHISEMVQISPGGDKYVFGIPAMNNVKKEVSIGVGNGLNVDKQTGIATVPGMEAASTGLAGSRDEFYTYTKTPAYARSFLLSSILSPDYIDVMNDGVTDDDLGTYLKFNYALKDADYRWRMPYSDGGEHAFYESGFNVDDRDNRASYSTGSKELWYAHSIESKNNVVEFYTSPRADGKGIKEGISNTAYSAPLGNKGSTYKLDSIKLYGKNDRFINGSTAVPIKTVYFSYDYDLCPNTPNSTATNRGKLTLKKVYTKFGNSRKSLLSPYQFTYSDFNPEYNPATKNNWGTYSPIDTSRPNYLFPYVNQFHTETDANMYASAWQLTKVKLPSGGEINVSYESDDYAYVQNKRAAEMTKVVATGSDRNYSSARSTLYKNKDEINKYLFVKKRGGSYFSSNLREVFLNNERMIYFNVATDITNRNFPSRDNYDQVKGFAEVESIGVCPDNSQYLYIELKPKKLDKGKMTLNPITYAGINLGRKDLSHVLYPGADNISGKDMFKGIWGSMKTLIQQLLLINPVKTMVKNGKARNIDVDRSFVRLSSPDLKKKGGGCRVKRIELNDNWDKLLGGEPNSTYGNEYDYTIEYKGKKISSGVASYEPFIGGDENALKQIGTAYKIQQGSKFPRNEPIHDIQLTPIGESFYPSPTVGYSQVITKSIHEPYAQSAQTALKTEYYTAKDYPVRVEGIGTLNSKSKHTPALLAIFSPVRSSSWYGSQKFKLILNDMHGKIKKVTNYAKRSPIPSAGKAEISSIEYRYAESGGKLNNVVETMNFNSETGMMEYGPKELGVEVETNTDSRWSRQRSFTIGVELNINIESYVPPIIIPSGIPILNWEITKFGSLVETQVVQQHGILKETEVITDGAKNIMRNEMYNPETGQVIVKSFNNEFNDRVYESSYPASWAYKGTSAIYRNLFYKSAFDSLYIDDCGNGEFYFNSQQRKALCQGDEILIQGPTEEKFWVGEMRDTTIWALDANGHEYSVDKCYAKGYPRDPKNLNWTSGNGTMLYNKGFQVVRSGRKNQLALTVQKSVSMSHPNSGSSAPTTPGRLVSLSTTTYDWRNVVGYHTNCSINPFLKGQMGNLRPSNSYVYYKNRDYTGHVRYDGLFDIPSVDEFWTIQSLLCETKLEPNTNSNVWKPTTNEIWYSPWGTEVQTTNPLAITSSAQFGYNRQLPVSICSNTGHNTFAFDGFEDYNTLISSNTIYKDALDYNLSPFKASTYFALQALTASAVTAYHNYVPSSAVNISDQRAHTGKYSLRINNGLAFALPVAASGVHHNRLQLAPNSKYIISLWIQGNISGGFNVQAGANQAIFKKKTTAIDGWTKYECSFNTTGLSTVTLNIPAGIYLDDFRVFPNKSNMKSFVYDHITNRLDASMDENNFASFYEYDQEGTLIRTKKETNKGIITITETRSAIKK